MRRITLAFGSVLLGGSLALAQAIVISPETGAEFRTFVTTEKIAPIELDADVVVGTPLPDTVVVQPVPDVIVTKAPEFKGYRYALVGKRIVVVEPSTTKVIGIIDE
jgi:hypothetical protein